MLLDRERLQRAPLRFAPCDDDGVLDRLEKGGWITRERDPSDRRAVAIRALQARGQELVRQYAGMNKLLDQIFERYDETQLEMIADFLTRIADAGRNATEELAKE